MVISVQSPILRSYERRRSSRLLSSPLLLLSEVSRPLQRLGRIFRRQSVPPPHGDAGSGLRLGCSHRTSPHLRSGNVDGVQLLCFLMSMVKKREKREESWSTIQTASPGACSCPCSLSRPQRWVAEVPPQPRPRPRYGPQPPQDELSERGNLSVPWVNPPASSFSGAGRALGQPHSVPLRLLSPALMCCRMVRGRQESSAGGAPRLWRDVLLSLRLSSRSLAHPF